MTFWGCAEAALCMCTSRAATGCGVVQSAHAIRLLAWCIVLIAVSCGQRRRSVLLAQLQAHA